MCVAHQYQHSKSKIGIEIERWPTSVTFYKNMGNSESYSEPIQTFKTELFVTTSESY